MLLSQCLSLEEFSSKAAKLDYHFATTLSPKPFPLRAEFSLTPIVGEETKLLLCRHVAQAATQPLPALPTVHRSEERREFGDIT